MKNAKVLKMLYIDKIFAVNSEIGTGIPSDLDSSQRMPSGSFVTNTPSLAEKQKWGSEYRITMWF